VVEWNAVESGITHEFLMLSTQIFYLLFIAVTWFGSYSYVKKQIMPIPKLQSIFKVQWQKTVATYLLSLILALAITQLAIYSTTFF
jgi:Ca2+/Na+ antiporter